MCGAAEVVGVVLVLVLVLVVATMGRKTKARAAQRGGRLAPARALEEKRRHGCPFSVISSSSKHSATRGLGPCTGCQLLLLLLLMMMMLMLMVLPVRES